jgi:hypothetical protein
VGGDKGGSACRAFVAARRLAINPYQLAEGSLANAVEHTKLPRKKLFAIQTLVVAIAISSACRSSTTPSTPTFDGSWAGTYVIGQCAVSGWSSCSGVGENNPLNLVLTQTGSTLSGTIEFPNFSMPVTGTVVSGTLNLTGHVLKSSDRLSTETADLMQWGSTLDQDGLIQGTFRYKINTTWGPGAPPFYPAFETWTSTYDAQIVRTCRTSDSALAHCR